MYKTLAAAEERGSARRSASKRRRSLSARQPLRRSERTGSEDQGWKRRRVRGEEKSLGIKQVGKRKQEEKDGGEDGREM
ncbi:hypothetical protein EYF80_035193 [Liparis tanakae]|uniref:Uncharacterized protein n=1 Tax=Liparis tanakae TaxID=230148 RepID=A0A4Z2GN15_9TELE|nr:hypothetical protein EYF80_035193 [Liparis tanakae]